MTEVRLMEGHETEKPMIDGFMLPDPRLLNAHELKEIFIQLSKEFATLIIDCKNPSEIKQLQNLQMYMRDLTHEIEIKDKSVFKSL